MKIQAVPYSHCHRCGGVMVPMVEGEEWPKICPQKQTDPTRGCLNVEFANPNPIGVMLQTVTDGERIGILTPVRGHAPMAGRPALTGGFQEMRDRSMQDAGARETHEEVGLPQVAKRDIVALDTRATGPFIRGRRQILFFGVNLDPVHISAYDGFVPDKETREIQFSWRPRLLAFPSHTYMMALYFQIYQNVESASHFMHQPQTGDMLEGREIFDIPYDQPRFDDGIWEVTMEEGGSPVGVVPDGAGWRRVD